MPLAEPGSSRQLLHTRTVRCYGYEREDGLWDIEGQMTDLKSYAIPNQDRGGLIVAGEPLHGMWVRLTVDAELLIHAVEAVTDWAPFRLCPEIVGRYQLLIGQHIKPGWNLKIKQLFKGVQGCTHLTELLGPLATTAYQTIHPRRRGEKRPPPGDQEQPRIINSCHALRSDGAVVREHWPRFYTGTEPVTAE
jgi:hypothetical protein